MDPESQKDVEAEIKPSWFKRNKKMLLITSSLLLALLLGGIAFLIWYMTTRRTTEVSVGNGVTMWVDESSMKMEAEIVGENQTQYLFTDFNTMSAIVIFTEDGPLGSQEVCLKVPISEVWESVLKMKGDRKKVRSPPRRKAIPSTCYISDEKKNETRFKTQLSAECYVTGYLTSGVPYEACCGIYQKIWFLGTVGYTKCVNLCDVALTVICATLNFFGIPCPSYVPEAAKSLCPKTRYATSYHDKNWGGSSYRMACTNQCNNIPKDWNDEISSIQTNGLPTTVYEHSDCRGASLVIPGEASNLRNIKRGGSNWNDVISSYRCG